MTLMDDSTAVLACRLIHAQVTRCVARGRSECNLAFLGELGVSPEPASDLKNSSVVFQVQFE